MAFHLELFSRMDLSEAVDKYILFIVHLCLYLGSNACNVMHKHVMMLELPDCSPKFVNK